MPMTNFESWLIYHYQWQQRLYGYEEELSHLN